MGEVPVGREIGIIKPGNKMIDREPGTAGTMTKRGTSIFVILVLLLRTALNNFTFSLFRILSPVCTGQVALEHDYGGKNKSYQTHFVKVGYFLGLIES